MNEDEDNVTYECWVQHKQDRVARLTTDSMFGVVAWVTQHTPLLVPGETLHIKCHEVK